MQAYREKQKKYYDRGTKERPEIKKSDAIRTLTSQGWQPAELIAKHDAPNSYIIKAGDQAKMFRKNSKELMVTKEKPHKIIPKPEPPLTVKPPPHAEENGRKQRKSSTTRSSNKQRYPAGRETSVLEDQYNSTTIIFLPKHLVMVVKSKAQPT